jgi:hypothetical protein
MLSGELMRNEMMMAMIMTRGLIGMVSPKETSRRKERRSRFMIQSSLCTERGFYQYDINVKINYVRISLFAHT